MKCLFSGILLLFIYSASAQREVSLSQSFRAKGDFVEQVTNAVNKWHQKNKENNYYTSNVDFNPKLITGDSILYELVFITKNSGLTLWKGEGKFLKRADKITCEVSSLIDLQGASIKGEYHTNSSLNKMHKKETKDRKRDDAEKEVKQFFKTISK